ncbi:ABC transporter ATP-binding protein [Govanella unica]|uniref:Dipeptide ABC transporter ATP-binding protein n=1 Tax=Govanella unica TaxID=2975056 RepID=A0A9X3U1G7_9PROT|nr:dipeptide ABC transporter ATP-binding protein [Govania unica]MDA5194829.1 dipeptide ABC transporter ATP-binding protein [Govania unica]
MTEALLKVTDLKVHFPIRTGGFLIPQITQLKAVDGVSFSVREGETLGIVGESGCGKSTLGRAILRLIEPTAGEVLWQGDDLAALDPRAMRLRRKELQIIFQDPLASLDPRMTVGAIIAEPLRALEPGLTRTEIRARVAAMMEQVGLRPETVNRYPHEFSGGQCQRIGIARAMILRPRLVLCDEPVSALDVSIQAQIVNLLMDLQREFGLTLLFISHDLAVVRHISHRVMVLYLGQVMEIADRDALYARPGHPYTRALLASVPVADPDAPLDAPPVAGDLPSPLDPPRGCVFSTRCPHVADICRTTRPRLEVTAPGHEIACHRWRDIA